MKQNKTTVEKYDRPEVEIISLFFKSPLCELSPGHIEGTGDEEVTP